MGLAFVCVFVCVDVSEKKRELQNESKWKPM